MSLNPQTTDGSFGMAVQRRSMSSVPGGSGENIVYIVLCGGAMVGALSYGYSTVTSDHARFNKRIEEIRARSNDEWSPKPWPPKSKSSFARCFHVCPQSLS
uniref:Uncharacterized protein n=1 Tax=Kryptolebias marmoratus TaxID=37003 RepID=A0A3Q2ZE28_KRYMA